MNLLHAPGVTVSDLLTALVLLVTVYNSWQGNRQALAIERLKVWILCNFQTKPDSILKEYRDDDDA